MTPARENGARLERFLIKQRGRRTIPVTPNRLAARPTATPEAANKLFVVSARIILYANTAENVSIVQAVAGSHELFRETVAAHASR
mmetsp:Transcript_7774/g.14060  ORF Transcript_7774/g.14060 Transcript_7774/m.14060 type:complete len:86 (+) Transcript_7774:878-1135(+)